MEHSASCLFRRISSKCPTNFSYTGIPKDYCNQRGAPGSAHLKIKCQNERDERDTGASSMEMAQNLIVLFHWKLFLTLPPAPIFREPTSLPSSMILNHLYWWVLMDFINEKYPPLASYTGGYVWEHLNFYSDPSVTKLFGLK